MSDLRDAGALLRLAYQGMLNAGVDADEVIKRIGLKQQDIQDASLRTPHSAQTLFWNTVEEVSGDPDIGLHLGEHLPIFKGQVLEYLFLSSPTFGEGLQRALNYQRLLSDAAKVEFHVEGELACINSGLSSALPIRHLNEALAQGLINFFKYVTDNHFTVRRVEFNHDDHCDLSEYERIFGCEVRFSCERSQVFFDKAVLEYQSSHAEPDLLRLHEQLASERVAKLEKQDVIGQVKRVIGEALESGVVNLESVAERLEMKPRELRNKLADAGTSFNQVLGDYRCYLAKRLLARTDESIDEIVYLTGFSEPSTFYRAFKRWVGETPIEYRKNKRAADKKADLS